MIVKIGQKLFDSNKTPIMLILSNNEKELIRDIGEQKRFCSFPEESDIDEVIEFMKVSDEILALVNYK